MNINPINEERILLDVPTRKLVRDFVPGEDRLDGITKFFSCLSDNTRIKIISALSISSMCVNDISYILGLNQTTVSHQLAKLKNIGVVKNKRQGKVIFYSLKDKSILDVMGTAVSYL
ncbi:MAG: metalloregulator ArsR/SmtB family transcription factor [Firmicutes bacterium]|nr:metalloregulator ArsR/SmtB family transcription factor [Bacillota bacterium]